MRICLFLLSILASLTMLRDARAELYYWNDRTGTRFVTDDASKIPAEYRSQATATVIPDEESEKPAASGGSSDTGYRTGNEYKMKKAKKGRSDTEQTDVNGRGEAYWRQRADSLREQLHDLQDEYEYACAQERACEERQVKASYLGKRQDCAGAYGREKAHLQYQIEQTKKRLEVDLPDEMRRSEAYPGWIR